MELERYQRLSSFYNIYWGSFCSQYLPLIEKYLYEIEGKANILDLACGTGLLSKLLASKGHNVVGLDLSIEMLKQAQKCNDYKNLSFVQGDMTDFAITKNFDLVVCSFDSLNYLLTSEDVVSMFKCVAKVLKLKGLFLFDFNTDKTYIKYNGCSFEKVFNEQNCIHTLGYNEETKEAVTTFTFADGKIEKHYQRPYSFEEIKELLTKSGFTIKEVFTSFNKRQDIQAAERIFILTNMEE